MLASAARGAAVAARAAAAGATRLQCGRPHARRTSGAALHRQLRHAVHKGQKKSDVIEAGANQSEDQLNRLSDLARQRRSLAQDLKQTQQQEERSLAKSVKINEQIPSNFKSYLITHIGTMDGDDEPVRKPPTEMSRNQALQKAKEMDMDLCLTGTDEEGRALCRLRIMRMWLRRQALEQTATERKQKQWELQDQEHVGLVKPRSGDPRYLAQDPYSERVIKIRSVIDKNSLSRIKAQEAADALALGKKVRVVLTFFTSADDVRDMIEDFARHVRERCFERRDLAVSFRVEQTSATPKGGQALLVPKVVPVKDVDVV